MRAQGISLDVDHGIYPYTTSSNTAAGHISTGTGVSFRHIDRIIGVVKAYLSRVGDGPLPSEILEMVLKNYVKRDQNMAQQQGDRDVLAGLT